MPKQLLFFLFAINSVLLIKTQSFIVTGRILDSISMQPLEAANIEEAANANNKASSDATGRFSIKVNSLSSILKASFIGYKNTAIQLAGKDNIKIEMLPAA